MNKKIVSSIVLSTVVWTGVSHAYVGLCCGKCGGNMPMNIPGGGVPETKEFRLKVSPMIMSMDGLSDGGDSIDADDILGMPVMNGMPTGKFMAAPTSMEMRMLNLTLGYSFTDDLFGGVMLMYRDNTMEMQFSEMMRTMTGQSTYDMESSGIGDTMLMGKYRLFYDDPLVPSSQASLFFGLSLPTGSIDEQNDTHPLEMRRDELLPYSMQLGSGTFDPTIGLLYQRSISPLWWGVNGMYTARLYDNERDYQLGDEFRIDVYGMYQFRHNLLAQVQLNARTWGEIEGEADESVTGESGRAMQGNPNSPFMTPLWDPDNYGGTSALVTVGFQWQPIPLHIIDFNVGVPIHQDLNGPQLEEEYRVMLTWYIEIPTKGSVRHKEHKANHGGSLGF